MKYKYNGWDVPIEKQLDKFRDRLHSQIKKEFGIDAYGDPPVDVILIDRTKYEPMHWWAVPYDHLAKTQEELDEIEKMVFFNLDTALARVQQLIRMRGSDRKWVARNPKKTVAKRNGS